MSDWLIWAGGIIAPWALFKLFKVQVASMLKVPPELGKAFAVGASLTLSVILGVITAPAKPVVRDAYYSLVKLVGVSVAGDRKNIEEYNNGMDLFNRY